MHWAWLLPALPALAAVLGPLTDRVLPGGPVVMGVAGAGSALVIAIIIFTDQVTGHLHGHLTQTAWTNAVGFHAPVGTNITGLSATLAVMVTAIALLVQIYSSAYMAGDRRYASYTAEVSLFTAAMLLTVVASNLVELLVGWEVMGLCSYLLVGHYWQTEGSRTAAVKALLVTRIGDAGFVVGIIILGVSNHSFAIATVNHPGRVLSCTRCVAVPAAVVPSHAALVAATLLLLMGVIGKSAQFPLHVWLPDAMAGPTPISALIHAATMVAAGVFLVARLYPVFAGASVSLTVLGIVACITMLGAALAALAQDDLKRVLAWSTVSQLAYMFAGLSVGGVSAGIFHLIGHAAFKALLFLAAGSVLRAVGTNLMSEMGGLWRRMPVTFATMLIGGLALAGVPPFAGVFGKDAILDAARSHGGGLGTAIVIVGYLTEFITAAYVARMICRTFLGKPRTDATVHESPAVMTIPLVVLAIAATGLGVLGLSTRYGVARWLGTGPIHVSTGSVVLSSGLAVAGIAVVAASWSRDTAADPLAFLGRVGALFNRGFFIDELYAAAFVRPVRRFASAIVEIDRRGIDATAVGSGRLAVLTGGGLRRLQTGNAQTYATSLVAGVVVILAIVAVAVAR